MIDIRVATVADAAELLQLARAIIIEGRWTFRSSSEFKVTLPQQRRWIRSQKYIAVGSLRRASQKDKDNNRSEREVLRSGLVGCVTLTQQPYLAASHRATLSVSVLRDYRGRGIGSQLIQSAILFAIADPTLKQIELTVFADNPVAIALYYSLGFTRIGQIPRVVHHGHYIDGILMYRDTLS